MPIFPRLSHFYAFGVLVGIFLLSLSCKQPEPQVQPPPFTATVNTDITYQTISGFGGASRMWGTQFLQPDEVKKVFGEGDNELGLSIFRIRVASNPSEWPLIVEATQEAQRYGARILASPWSPPAALKSNNSDIGGRLPEENYQAFVDHLNDFLDFMADNGIEIYAISIQNEPDIEVSYESCDWTSGHMTNFLADYGHLIEGAQVAAPESFQFNQNYTNTLLNDAEASQHFDIVAGHIYGGGLAPFPLAEQQGKEVWMTEYLLNMGTGNAGATPWREISEEEIWDESLEMLGTIHESMLLNWNAYIWWYIQRYYSFLGDGTEDTPDGEILKRGYAFSHFSKWVRPGFVRVDVQLNKNHPVDITAYESADQIVVVAITPEEAPVPFLHIAVPSVSSARAFETNLTNDRQEIEATIVDGAVKVDLDPKGVTTIVIEK